MKKYSTQVIFALLFVISGSACRPKEQVITKWPGGQKQVTYKIFSGDTAHLTDVFYCAYYPNGKEWKSGYYKNGRAEGVWYYFYQSGKPKSEGTFIRGIRHGRFKTFYESGQVEQDGYYVNDKMEPDVKYFNRDHTRKAEKEDLSRYLVEHPVKWTEAQREEIRIDFYTAVVGSYLNGEEFSVCVADLLQRRCNYQDIQLLTDKQRGDLLATLASQQQECYSLLEVPKPRKRVR